MGKFLYIFFIRILAISTGKRIEMSNFAFVTMNSYRKMITCTTVQFKKEYKYLFWFCYLWLCIVVFNYKYIIIFDIIQTKIYKLKQLSYAQRTIMIVTTLTFCLLFWLFFFIYYISCFYLCHLCKRITNILTYNFKLINVFVGVNTFLFPLFCYYHIISLCIS